MELLLWAWLGKTKFLAGEIQDVHLHAHNLLVTVLHHSLLLWLKTWFTEFQPYSQLPEQQKAGRNTDLHHRRGYTQLAPGSDKLASCDLVGIGRNKTGMPLTLFFLVKRTASYRGGVLSAFSFALISHFEGQEVIYSNVQVVIYSVLGDVLFSYYTFLLFLRKHIDFNLASLSYKGEN